jgi:hypothetical protein
MPARFPLGHVYFTRGVLEQLSDSAAVFAGLARHAGGDWGDVSAEAAAENDFSVGRPLRILSAYVAENGTRFWVITEADRSATTVLLPDEY